MLALQGPPFGVTRGASVHARMEGEQLRLATVGVSVPFPTDRTDSLIVLYWNLYIAVLTAAHLVKVLIRKT